MRPRKIVFLFCNNDDERGAWSYTLDVKGYTVCEELYLCASRPDAALIVHDPYSTDSIAIAGALDRSTPIFVLFDSGRRLVGYPCDVQFLSRKLSHAEILERVKIAARRKTGPKKAEPVQEKVSA